MFRIIAVFLALISPAFAQVATPDESLQGIVTLAKNRRFSSRFGWATSP
jgi:hypothetical protein